MLPNNKSGSNAEGIIQWHTTARRATEHAGQNVACPLCGKSAVRAAWQLSSFARRTANVTLNCQSCSVTRAIEIELPSRAVDCYPITQLAAVKPALVEEAAGVLQFVNEHTEFLPAAAWLANPLWLVARWSATAYRWHPTSEQPPVMGFVFENAEAGKELFRCWNAQQRSCDELEEIRIAIIEGGIPRANALQLVPAVRIARSSSLFQPAVRRLTRRLACRLGSRRTRFSAIRRKSA